MLYREIFIQYSLLELSATLACLNATFRGLAPSPSSGKSVLPEDGDRASPQNVAFKRANAAESREDYIESCRCESFKRNIRCLEYIILTY
jgi:hypothetical protein